LLFLIVFCGDISDHLTKTKYQNYVSVYFVWSMV